MKLDLQDLSIRALFLLAGGIAAVILTMQGHGEALPAVAVGGGLGAWFAARVQGPANEES
ncbi:MAG TPA: hypothetical protein VF111_07410 [Thermoanaerobaculia bacterium]